MKNLKSGILALFLTVLVGCAASTPPGVGVWDVNMNTPLGALPGVLTMNADGTGSFGNDQLGDTALSGIMYDGNSIAFDAEVDAQGQTLVLEFTGTVEGDSLDGEFGSDFGAFDVTGTRQ